MSQDFYEQAGTAMTCRDFEEYRRMFMLAEETLASAGAILDVAAGGSSFVANVRSRGIEAYAVDPRYNGDELDWVAEAREEIAASTAKLEGLKDRFDWSYYGDLDRHRAGRESSLERFRQDLLRDRNVVATDQGNLNGRYYLGGGLPELPFEDGRFGLVLCSHFLFLYAEQFDFEFHRRAVLELMRVCRPGGRILVYPLITLHWKPYDKLEELMDLIREAGGVPELRSSSLPFIPGSNQYLHISKNE